MSLRNMACAGRVIAGSIVFLLVSLSAQAGIIPLGIQTNVTQATVDSWGWTECHRSATNSGSVASTAVTDNCSGTHLAMGAFDASLGAYGVVGMGEYDVVTAYTYQYYTSSFPPIIGSSLPLSDDAVGGELDNWSNGVNFYRTAGFGSWGFTSLSKVELTSADILLFSERRLLEGDSDAVGLSLHTNADLQTDGISGGDFSTGWQYNATGTSAQSLYNAGDQRVFWTLTVQDVPVPAPATLALLGLGLAGLGFARRKKA